MFTNFVIIIVGKPRTIFLIYLRPRLHLPLSIKNLARLLGLEIQQLLFHCFSASLSLLLFLPPCYLLEVRSHRTCPQRRER